MATERIISGTAVSEADERVNWSLRPERFDDFVGQGELLERLRIAAEAARARSEPMEHTLLHGPPGLGKTTLAHVLAAEMGTRAHVTSGPALELTVNDEPPGATVEADGPARVSIHLRAPIVPGGMLRLIENGRVTWERPADARTIDATLERSLDHSAWIAARLDGERRIPAGDVAVAHTSPVYVDVDGPVVVADALETVRAQLADPDAIAESGSSNAHEREVALRWAAEARRVLARREAALRQRTSSSQDAMSR